MKSSILSSTFILLSFLVVSINAFSIENLEPSKAWLELFDAGNKAIYSSQYPLAQQKLEVALKTAFADNIPLEIAASQAQLGHLHYLQQDFIKAERAFKASLTTLEKSSLDKLPENVSFYTGYLSQLALNYEQQNRYAEAEDTYRRALVIIQEKIGSNTLKAAHIIQSLGTLKKRQGQYPQAQRYYEQSLAVCEKNPQDQRGLAMTLDALATITEQQGHYNETAKYYQRSVDAWKTLPKDIGYGSHLLGLANFYRDHWPRYDEAEKLYRESLAVVQPLFPKDHPTPLTIQSNLAQLHTKQGRYREAETWFKQDLAIRQKYQQDPVSIAISMGNLGFLANEQGRYTEAENAYLQQLAVFKKALPQPHPHIATVLFNLGQAASEQGHYLEAKQYYEANLSMLRQLYTEDHPDIAASLSNLGSFYASLGQNDKAEQNLQKALSILQTKLPENHPETASVLNQLGLLYAALGRFDEAEPILERSLKIRETILGSQHPEVAVSLNNLARLYDDAQNGYPDETKPSTQHFDKAEQYYRRCIAIQDQGFSDINPTKGTCLQNLGGLYLHRFRYEQNPELLQSARQYLQAAQKIDHAIYLPNHPALADSLMMLAAVDREQGRYAAAETLYEEILRLRKQANLDHPQLAVSLYAMAKLQALKQDYAKALAYINEAVAIYAKHPLTDDLNADVTTNETEAQNRQQVARLQVQILQKMSASGDKQTHSASEDAFQSMQMAHGIKRSKAFQQTALRLASGNLAIRAQVKELWNLQTHWQTLHQHYLSALGQSSQESAAKAERLGQEQAQTSVKIQQLDQALKQSFPAYAQLIHPEPIHLQTAQGLLQADEALLTYVVDEDMSFLSVVRPGQAPRLYSLNIGRKNLNATIQHLRASLTLDEPLLPQKGLPLFDLATAFGLYQSLFAPAESALVGVKHIMVVADGSMQSLPLHVLLKSTPPENAPGQHGNYAQADWLARHYAFSYLPAVHSLAYLRGNPKVLEGSKSAAPFIGFGDPVLMGGNPSALIRDLERLPETADELNAIAQFLGADLKTAVYLRESATESQVKRLSASGQLRQHRVVSFASHALMPPQGEPGLVLTPPATIRNGDDGYLSASEAAALSLDADWVLLSACDTATQQAQTNEGLSQLAKSFFVAGTRSVLASHWPVASKAAQQLTTGMFSALRDQPNLRRAEALQHSMLALLNQPNECELLCKLGVIENNPPTHPLYWAPFVILGEGGSLRAE